eukprot:3940512-Rhodomonas_salina.2
MPASLCTRLQFVRMRTGLHWFAISRGVSLRSRCCEQPCYQHCCSAASAYATSSPGSDTCVSRACREAATEGDEGKTDAPVST